jgi:hypothetical protein
MDRHDRVHSYKGESKLGMLHRDKIPLDQQLVWEETHIDPESMKDIE